MDEVVERQPTPPLAPSNATTNSIPAAAAAASSTGRDEAGMKTSYDALEAQSQLLRQSFVAQNQEGKKLVAHMSDITKTLLHGGTTTKHNFFKEIPLTPPSRPFLSPWPK
jgi:hypothetical protein